MQIGTAPLPVLRSRNLHLTTAASTYEIENTLWWRVELTQGRKLACQATADICLSRATSRAGHAAVLSKAP